MFAEEDERVREIEWCGGHQHTEARAEHLQYATDDCPHRLPGENLILYVHNNLFTLCKYSYWLNSTCTVYICTLFKGYENMHTCWTAWPICKAHRLHIVIQWICFLCTLLHYCFAGQLQLRTMNIFFSRIPWDILFIRNFFNQNILHVFKSMFREMHFGSSCNSFNTTRDSLPGTQLSSSNRLENSRSI